MNKVVKNYIYNLSYQILVLLVPLITTPYVSRVLGAKGVGAFSYTNSIVQYFILFGCIGLNLYGQREIAYVQHEKENRNRVFWELLILRFITVGISLIVFYFSLCINGQYSHIFIIMTLDIIASMIDVSWFFQGIEDFKKIVIRNFIIKILGVLLIFLFVKSASDLRIYVLCHSATLFFGNLSMWFYLPKFVKRITFKELHIKRHVRPTIVLFLPQIATSVYNVLDKTMIGLLSGIEEEVAFYEQSQKIVKIVMALVTSLGTVMLPRVANLFKLKEMEKIQQYLSKSFHFVCFIAFPMMFGLMAISCSIVPWFFGEGYDKVIPNMMMISPIIVIIAMSNIMGTQYLLPIGRQKEFTISVVSGCIVNCCLNLLLIPKFLSIGAAIATIVAEFSVTAVQVFFTRKDFDFKNIIFTNRKYIICASIMFIPTFLMARKLSASITHSMICVIVGGVVYFGLLYIMRDDALMDVVDKVKAKVKRN